jgi:hypothetical protein
MLPAWLNAWLRPFSAFKAFLISDAERDAGYCRHNRGTRQRLRNLRERHRPEIL